MINRKPKKMDNPNINLRAVPIWNADTLKEYVEMKHIQTDQRFQDYKDAMHEALDKQHRAALDFFNYLVKEKQAQYDRRWNAIESHFVSDLASQKELMETYIEASDKAVTKAEAAQREYNLHSNEFRAQLEDQQKNFMTRTEAVSNDKAVENKIDALQKTTEGRLLTLQEAFEDKLVTLKTSIDKTIDRNIEDIKTLREYRSETTARRISATEYSTLVLGIAIVIATVLPHFLK